jgi:hypothetical protein
MIARGRAFGNTNFGLPSTFCQGPAPPLFFPLPESPPLTLPQSGQPEKAEIVRGLPQHDFTPAVRTPHNT